LRIDDVEIGCPTLPNFVARALHLHLVQARAFRAKVMLISERVLDTFDRISPISFKDDIISWMRKAPATASISEVFRSRIAAGCVLEFSFCMTDLLQRTVPLEIAAFLL
jgi:hypothetical protein